MAVNAPMGSGKTKVVSELLNSHLFARDQRAIVITHRGTLARSLASRFNMACYLDPEFLHAEKIRSERIVICLNSLRRLLSVRHGGVRYCTLVLDEAGLVRRHFISNTFATKAARTEAYDAICEIAKH